MNLKLQTIFSTILLLSLFSVTIAIVAVPSEAQISFNREKRTLDPAIFFLLDRFEYTFDINGTQIFPNDTIKHSILTEYKQSVYNIPRLQYVLFGHTISASDVQVYVTPTRIDDTKTRLDIQIHANNPEVRGQYLNKSYKNLDLNSVYGIYDNLTDKMTIHVPYSVALSLLLQ